MDHLLSPYEKYCSTPSKSKKLSSKTPEKRREHKKQTKPKEIYLPDIQEPTPVKKKQCMDFALAAVDEDTFDKDGYTSMIVSRNQLANIRQCKYCNMIFDQIRSLQDHTILKHFDEKISSILSSKSSRRFCPSCRKMFRVFLDLKFHYGIKHHCSESDLKGILLWSELGNATLYFPKDA